MLILSILPVQKNPPLQIYRIKEDFRFNRKDDILTPIFLKIIIV